MSATIRPYGMLKDYIGGKSEIEVEPDHSVRELMVSLGMPPDVVALVTVNEQQQDKDYVIQEGDVVKLIAVIGGG